MKWISGFLTGIVMAWVIPGFAQTLARFGGGGYDGYSTESVTYTLGYCKVFNTGGATVLSDTRAFLNGAVATGTLNAGQTVDVSVCWGTADGGTNTSAWAAVTPVAKLEPDVTIQSVSAWITTLAPCTTHYYRYVAEDAENHLVWASETVSFMTFGLPDVGDISSRYTGGGYDGYAAQDAQGWIRDAGMLILLF